jgi:hypothetical protein
MDTRTIGLSSLFMRSAITWCVPRERRSIAKTSEIRVPDAVLARPINQGFSINYRLGYLLLFIRLAAFCHA